jgi:hypothetical protein
MAEVLAEGATLDQQARALAQWAKRGLTTVGALDPGDFELPARRRRRSRRDGSEADTGSDERSTQKISARDIEAGVVRIPLGSAKGLFPAKASDVEVELRGTRLTAKWDPRFGRTDGRECSGRLSVDKRALTDTVEADERLRIEQIGSYIRLS